MDNTGKSPYGNELMYAVKRFHNEMEKALNRLLKPYDLSYGQWYMLLTIHRHGKVSQKELQKIMEIEPATISRIIDSLIRKGWLIREEKPDDRRMKELKFTVEGKKRWQKLPDLISTGKSIMYEDVDEAQMDITLDVLKKITERFQHIQ